MADLKSDLAYDDIEALLTGVDDLPAAMARNDKRLEEFAASGTAKIRHRLTMFTEAPRVLAVQQGKPPSYELAVPCTIVYMVEGEAGEDRDTVWRAGLAALAATLFPDGEGYTSAGMIENTTLDDYNFDHILEEARAPVEVAEITISLFVTAPTPFG